MNNDNMQTNNQQHFITIRKIINNTDTSKNKIPKAVIKAAESKASLGSGNIAFIGKYKGCNVYTYQYNEELTIGLPEIYITIGPFVKVVTGYKAVIILNAIK